MQAVEEGDVDEIRGPDHGSGPDQETASQASQAISCTQRGDSEEKLESPAKVLLVKEALRQQNIGRIQHATAIGSLRRDIVSLCRRRKGGWFS